MTSNRLARPIDQRGVSLAVFEALPTDLRSWALVLSRPDASVQDTGNSDPSLPFQPPDWQSLYGALNRHRVAPLALRHAEQYSLPAEFTALLRNAQTDNIGRAFASVAHLARLADAFEQHGVSWCVLKGIPLALRVYGDIAARCVGDIDILVPPHQTDLVDTLLRTCGWQAAVESAATPWFWHEKRYVEPSGMDLELHRRPHPNPLLLPLSTATLLEGCITLNIGGARIPVLDPSTELLYLATHGSRHGWYRLQWLCDIAMISARTPPELLDQAHREATQLGLLKPLAQGLLLAESLFGVPAPGWAQTLKRQSAGVQAQVSFAEETLWCARDASGNPIERTQSSLRNALDQRLDLRFWLWELALRTRHEWHQWRASQ